MDAGARFCPSCGAAAAQRAEPSASAPPTSGGAYRQSATAPWSYPSASVGPGAMPDRRVARNLRRLATLWLVYAGFRAIGGLIGLLAVIAIGTHHFGPLPWVLGDPLPGYLRSPAWLGFAVPAIAVSTVIACGLALVTGLALLHARSWGRILALIAAVLALLKFPLGTALGVYTLWVLASSRAAAEYNGLAGRG